MPFHLGTGSLGLEHSSADAGEQSPQLGGAMAAPSPFNSLCPSQLWGQQDPRVSSSLPGHPQPSRERARCVQLGHVASPNLAVLGSALHHEEKQDGQSDRQGDVTIPGDTLGTLPPAPHPAPCKV